MLPNKIATPSLAHVDQNEWDNVYEPAEDTFVFIDALELDLKHIFAKGPTVCLEIGSGSGTILTALGSVLGNSAVYLATDINEKACVLTKRTALANGIEIESICANLSPLRDGIVDMVIFNPPYVPTEQVVGNGIERSWAGGKNGRQVIDRFLRNVVPKLAPKALGYLLLIQENKPKDVVKILENLNFSVKIMLERKIRGEFLLILSFEKE